MAAGAHQLAGDAGGHHRVRADHAVQRQLHHGLSADGGQLLLHQVPDVLSGAGAGGDAALLPHRPPLPAQAGLAGLFHLHPHAHRGALQCAPERLPPLAACGRCHGSGVGDRQVRDDPAHGPSGRESAPSGKARPLLAPPGPGAEMALPAHRAGAGHPAAAPRPGGGPAGAGAAYVGHRPDDGHRGHHPHAGRQRRRHHMGVCRPRRKPAADAAGAYRLHPLPAEPPRRLDA